MTTTPAVAPVSIEMGQLAALAALAREGTEALIAHSGGETDHRSLAGRLRTILAAVEVTARTAGIDLVDAIPTPVTTVRNAAEVSEDWPAVVPSEDRATRQAQMLRAGAALVEQMPDAGLMVEVRDSAHRLEIVPQTFRHGVDDAANDRANLDVLAELRGRLDGEARTTAHVSAVGALHITVTGGTWLGLPARAYTIIDPGAVQDAARAWLAQIGVEVR
ncbi:hypothetical protein [Pseudofrankia inefficax]|uniref:Uncharacterized protein n=1 Tax=Pseudofrankia inefficax (strain DSM 45817 / CECT 9037 / DDB 130130 / EuI1c) TaxID=298654 RepID=E3IX47_PSEI1|nr:hypothetical protein [Pseudofrankia inefficax]ADP83819.1 hypothetical protein FraEuI1c_5835 [Pseudofrankia inefficax]